VRSTTPLLFVFHSVTAGLAVAFLILLLFPDWLAGARGRHPLAQGHNGAPSYAEAVARAAPAVVNLYTTRYAEPRRDPLLEDPVFFGDQRPHLNLRTETSLGSGVILDARGYLLTNHHVVAGADAIEVALSDGRTAPGLLVGTDPETDLAVIRADLHGLPAIGVGDSDALRVGDVVLAIGNPFGVGQTVTQGIISATGRNRVGINTFENFIQTDAAINPGNSGGALVNGAGELIGINTAIISQSGGAQGVGFAIPVAMAREIMEDIIRDGTVVRGWLGMETYDLTPGQRRALAVREQGGVIVKGVVLNGPADDADLRPRDVVTHINDVPVQSARHGLEIISRLKPGSEIAIGIIRDGQRLRREATVAERPLMPFLRG